jgi:hypothetical protein
MARISAPLFAFGDREPVETTDEYLRNAMPGGELAMAGPSVRPDGRTIPVRGDLAHIRLAGIHFVPHYAVPMAHVAGPHGAHVRLAGIDDAEALGSLKAGAAFDVLEIAGDWTWGEVPGGNGPVGYVALSELQAATS